MIEPVTGRSACPVTITEIQVLNADDTVSDVPMGPVEGGTRLIVWGEGVRAPETSIWFGGVQAPLLPFCGFPGNDSQVNAVLVKAPQASGAGIVPISVRNPAGETLTSATFSYEANLPSSAYTTQCQETIP